MWRTVVDQSFRLAELDSSLEEKERQRKALAAKIWQPARQAGSPKPLGKPPGARGFQRPVPKLKDITHGIFFSPDECPHCGSQHLGLPQPEHKLYLEDIVLPVRTVTLIGVSDRWCGDCKKYVRHPEAPPDLSRVPRLGPVVMGMILYLRFRQNLPYQKIQQAFLEIFHFPISEGEIASQLEEAAHLFGDHFQAVIELIRSSDRVNCDETGWRIKGENCWLWIFASPGGIRYELAESRGRRVAEEVLGNNPNRVLGCDFYGAYTNLAGEKQRCWAHLLRDARSTESRFAEELKALFLDLNFELTRPLEERQKKPLAERLAALAAEDYRREPNWRQIARLQARIVRFHEELLTCLYYQDIPPTNNAAERPLRPAVVKRKIWGGSRSKSGAKATATVMSVLDTLRLQYPGQGFFATVLPKLRELRHDFEVPVPTSDIGHR